MRGQAALAQQRDEQATTNRRRQARMRRIRRAPPHSLRPERAPKLRPYSAQHAQRPIVEQRIIILCSGHSLHLLRVDAYPVARSERTNLPHNRP